jgi:hypothetical protein
MINDAFTTENYNQQDFLVQLSSLILLWQRDDVAYHSDDCWLGSGSPNTQLALRVTTLPQLLSCTDFSNSPLVSKQMQNKLCTDQSHP